MPLLVDIRLGFEDGATDQSVYAPPYLRDTALKVQVAKFSAELFDEKLAEVRLDLVVPWFASEMLK
jgi:hypothetical protein